MNDPHLASVLSDLDRLQPRADEVLRGITETQFHSRPDAGGWSVAQIFEHLCLVDSSYVDGCILKAMVRARRPEELIQPYRPSLMGGYLRRALANPAKKMPAPKAWRVSGPVRPNVVESWRDGVRRLRAHMLNAVDLDLNIGLSSPVSLLVRIRLGDALSLPVLHGHRHLAQVERTRKAVSVSQRGASA